MSPQNRSRLRLIPVLFGLLILFSLPLFLLGATRQNPTGIFTYFSVDVPGIATGFFETAFGIGSESEIIESKVVTANGVEVVQKIPGRLKWSDITLKRGVTTDTSFHAWRAMVENGDVIGAKKEVTLVAFDPEMSEVARWTLSNAWPSKTEVSSVEGATNLSEVITIVHEGLVREN